MSITTTIIGNLAADPELRFTPSGVAAASFTIAVNERYRDKDGAWQDGPTSWVRCNAWRQLAEHICESFTKGDRVIAHGNLRQRDWENSAGEKRTAWEVTVTDIGASVRYATVKIAKAERREGPEPEDEPPPF